MSVPGFAAEASLYRSRRVYSGYVGAERSDGTSIEPSIAQLCGTQCYEACLGLVGATQCLACWAAAETCSGFWCWFAYAACLLVCGGQTVDCLLNCPECGGSGSGGPPECCGEGRTCSCGGRCVPFEGGYRCVGGTCLGPHERCQ